MLVVAVVTVAVDVAVVVVNMVVVAVEVVSSQHFVEYRRSRLKELKIVINSFFGVIIQ